MSPKLLIDATFPTGDDGMTSCDGRPGTWKLGHRRAVDEVLDNQRRCLGLQDDVDVEPTPAPDDRGGKHTSKEFLEDIVASRHLNLITDPSAIEQCVNASRQNMSTIKAFCNKWDGSALEIEDLTNACSQGYINAACEGHSSQIPKVYNAASMSAQNNSYYSDRLPLTHVLKNSSEDDCVKNGIGYMNGRLTCNKAEIALGNSADHIYAWEKDLSNSYIQHACKEIVNTMRKNNVKCSYMYPVQVRDGKEAGVDTYSLIEQHCINTHRLEAVCYQSEDKKSQYMSFPVNPSSINVFTKDWPFTKDWVAPTPPPPGPIEPSEPVPQPKPVTYELYPGTAIRGGDINTEPFITTLEDCQQRCTDNGDCHGINYGRAGAAERMCFLEGANWERNQVNEANWNFYKKVKPT